MATLLLTGAILSSPGWVVQRCVAGTGFPTSPTDGPTFSIGVCQLVVDPSFAFLFAPSTTYPGYSPGSGVLTSPVMFDGNTMIGESATYDFSTQSFPVTVGTPAGVLPYPPSYGSISGYSDYSLIPSAFSSAPAGIDQIFTQIEDLNLQAFNSQSGVTNECPDSRVPNFYTPTVFSVVAGPMEIANLPLNRRSIGMVQQITPGPSDFPGQSFFNMFVQVTLPPVPTTVSINDFPGSGAVLYNDATDPLLIINDDVTSVPPAATYIHGQTTAVPIKFLTGNPPYWAAGDVLGYLTLAGHGVFTNANPTLSLPPPPCLAAQPGGLLDTILGQVGSPVASPPVPWLRSDDSFPTPGSTYNSFVNSFINSGTPVVLDDTASFTVPALGTFYVRDLVLSGLDNSITPPSLGTSAPYSAANTALNFQFSSNGVNFFAEASSSPGTVAVTITNNGPIGSTAVYGMEMLSMNNSASSIFGTVYLRESPTKQSLGQHTIAPDPRGFRVSSFFDVFLELSFNGTDWFPAKNSIRMQAGMPPAAPGSIFITNTGTKIELNWQNNFVLQSATDVSGPYTDVSGGAAGPVTTGPYFPSVGGSQMYFRLRQTLPFSQLQVLLPGESAAPGTVTGKTGTPTPQTADTSFDIVVRAVDANWNLVNSSDEVHVASTDGTAILPSDANLVNGSVVLSMAFGSPGQFTVTGSDVTDPSKTPYTSAPVMSQ
jgi:hypothetical protein